jgi:hypothetical protein
MKPFKQTDDLEQMVEDLEEASGMEGSETGELWSRLACLWSSSRDYLSDDFVACLEAEIKVNHETLCTEYNIVERTETITRTGTYLEYIG